jgi:hypothetical protein
MELNDMAAPAIMGLSVGPPKGKNMPIAIGIANTL